MSRYNVTVTIEYEVDDLAKHNDVMQVISTPLPYMTDNVFIRSHITDRNQQSEGE